MSAHFFEQWSRTMVPLLFAYQRAIRLSSRRLTRGLASTRRMKNVKPLLCHRTSVMRTSTATNSFEVVTSPSEDDILKINHTYSGILRIGNVGSRGLGLISLTEFKAGDLIVVGVALSSSAFQDSHTIQTDINEHVTMDLPALLLNHVCGSANMYACDNAFGAYNFHARSAIAKGEELTFDYETTEYELDWHQCQCGSHLCRGKLRGFKHNECVVRDSWEPHHIAAYLNKMSFGCETNHGNS
jgi:uncharacterized protein